MSPRTTWRAWPTSRQPQPESAGETAAPGGTIAIERPPLLRGPGFHLPDQAAVVRRHRQVVHQSQPDAAREFIDRLEVADPRARVKRLQPRVEVAVAVAGIYTVGVEGAVTHQRSAFGAGRTRCGE